ncbi:tetratricopeptide repeat protein [Micromonospora sp. WMMD1128]|uniref:tetratricopeptide repeat protein n=1 Tax=Micromonospora sp. WMMD1128 TaxID=3015150 RepID=UPI00248C9BA8|nr:tetratricopeptide repeat protein [Micromonospora sp. WMMD1128]WBB75577.1 tetratricopeptide repeat protein [Micromonospora sp. WMMD1128]
MTGSVVFGDVIQISHVDGGVTVISPDRPPYRVSTADSSPVPVGVPKARSHPSCLLLARHQVVPFAGRERTLDALAEWVRGGEPVAALLVHGAGGQGKTRLAAEVTARCAAAGWAAWKVVHTPTPVPGTAPVSRVELPGGAVLAVVDYADRWPASALLALLIQLRDLHTRTGARVRVLMLARSDGYWWPAVANRAESDLGIDTGQVALPPLAADSDDDRLTLFTTAAARFAAAMNIERAGWPVPDLTGPAFAQVLAVHMAALATVDAIRHGDVPPVRGDAVSAYLLLREEAYWHELRTGPEDPLTTPPAVMHRAVYTATLIGAQPRSAARRALSQAGFAADSAAADRIIDDHTTCYPPTDTRLVFEPLHPDRLGEDLIALSTPGHGGLTTLEKDWAPIAVADLLTADGPQLPAWSTAAVTTLVETARRWPHIATDVLYPLIRRRPELVVAAGGATLTRLAAVPDIDPAILEILEPLLPQGRHIDLDIAAAAITGHLTRHRLAHATGDADRAWLHAIHAWRLANAGQHVAALASAQEAAGVYRRLAEADPASLPGLAMSLNNLGNHLSGVGRREEALAPTEEAAGIWRRLAMVNPAAYLPHLSGALNNLGNHLSGVGRREEALAPAEEAVAIRRRLAEADPDAYLPELAGSLANLGSRLAEVGRREEALARTEEAAGVYRRLAEADPTAHLPDFATSLHNLGNELSGVGRREEALAQVEEAVTIRRRLAEANPAAHRPDLAMSLTSLGTRLLALGRREEALAPAEEAVTIRRRLAEANPAAHLPDLATSLNNLGVLLAEVGRREEALALAEKAAGIWRRLAEANPAAHLPDLATSLMNVSERLSQVGRREEAPVPAEEATGIWRRLAGANPAAHLPQLAGSLDNLGVFLSQVGRWEEALVPAEEAMTIRRHLAEVNPAVYLSHLAISLSNRGALLFTVGCREEALALAEGAVDVYRRLAEANPAAHLPDLATSLNNLGVLRSEPDKREQALAAAEEATAIHRRLAGANPAAYLPHLAMSLTNVSERLSQVGRREEALAAAEEAVTIRRRLAEANPVAYLPFLARSLSAYARVCVSVDADMTGALAAVTEAVGLYEPLARQLPQAFADHLSDARQIRADIIGRLGGEPEH